MASAFYKDDRVPQWDRQRARWLIGKHTVVAITKLAGDRQTVIEHDQYHGIIVAVHKARGIRINCLGELTGKQRILPPDTSAFEDAEPGEYWLRATGEKIIDPDLVSTWTLSAPLH